MDEREVGETVIYSNLEFFILLGGSLFIYQMARNHYHLRFFILLLSSLLFYAWAGIFDTVIFIFVVAISWLAVFLAERFSMYRKPFIVSGIAIMALHLFFWKYGPWITSLIQKLYPQFNSGLPFVVPLPVGISFFTLQGIAYLIDYYKREAEFMPLKRYLLFKSFFPQLVAGPIVRVHQLLPQLERLPLPSSLQVKEGVTLFVTGFFKKVAVADRMATFVNPVFAKPHAYDRLSLASAVLAYTVQIWGDFSGYTDMGRGVAKLFGIDLPENFLSPYLSQKPSEFWRRWHITLSQWIRDYIYLPMGGSRGGMVGAVVVAIVTMAISGLWHGAGLTFILWGLYHGLLLALERIAVRTNLNRRMLGFLPGKLQVNVRIFMMFTATMFGWLMFRSQSFDLFSRYLASFNSQVGSGSLKNIWEVGVAILVCFGIQRMAYVPLEKEQVSLFVRLRDRCQTERLRVHAFYPLYEDAVLSVSLAVLFVLSLLLRASQNSAQFIYFQF